MSGVLTLDVSNSSELDIQLFSSAPEGSFSEIILIGADECAVANLGKAGELYISDPCLSSLAHHLETGM